MVNKEALYLTAYKARSRGAAEQRAMFAKMGASGNLQAKGPGGKRTGAKIAAIRGEGVASNPIIQKAKKRGLNTSVLESELIKARANNETAKKLREKRDKEMEPFWIEIRQYERSKLILEKKLDAVSDPNEKRRINISIGNISDKILSKRRTIERHPLSIQYNNHRQRGHNALQRFKRERERLGV